MLNKLLKYEFKATGRMFVPAYGLLILMAIIQRVMMETGIYNSNNFSVNLLSMIVPSIFIAAIVAVFVITLVAMINRFYKNLLGREGYLMFTLPVSVSKMVWSKIIVVIVWSILSLIIGVLTFTIVFYEPGYFSNIAYELEYIISQIRAFGTGHIVGYIVEIIAFMVTSLASFVLMIYLCLSIGQLSNKHRGLCSFGAFIGINIIINNILAAIFNEFLRYMNIGDIGDLFGSMAYTTQIHMYLLTIIAAMVIQAAVFFFVTRYILTNKLNLE